jgi:hypothetical protein
MKASRLKLFVWILLGCSLLFALRMKASAASPTQQTSVNKAFELLVSCPRWDTLGAAPEDRTRMQQITETLRLLSAYDDGVIRGAMERYMRCYNSRLAGTLSDECSIPASKLSVFNLMVLNRFVFVVPKTISIDRYEKMHTYLRMVAPIKDGEVNLLWPVTIVAGQEPALTEQFYGNMGPLPDPIGEFDAFKKAFQRRRPATQG